MRFYSPEQVAAVLNAPLDTVHDLIGSGELLAIRLGSRGPWRVDTAHLEAFIRDQYQVAHAPEQIHSTTPDAKKGSEARVYEGVGLEDGRWA